MANRSLGSSLIVLILTLTGCATSPDPGIRVAEEYYNLGNEWFNLKKYDNAARAYQTALGWNPNLKIATLNLARTKAELGDAAGALALLQPVVDADPGNLVAKQYVAWLTAKGEGLTAAADLYAELALKLPGDQATQFNAGLCLHAAGRDTEALTALTTWKALGGKDPEGLQTWAELVEDADQPAADAWLEVAQALPENDSKRFFPMMKRALALEKAELYGDAVASWEAALALPPSKDQTRGEALFRQGALLLLQIEDYQRGSKSLLEAWKAGYQDEAAWKDLKANPSLKFGPRLEADLKALEVKP